MKIVGQAFLVNPGIDHISIIQWFSRCFVYFLNRTQILEDPLFVLFVVFFLFDCSDEFLRCLISCLWSAGTYRYITERTIRPRINKILSSLSYALNSYTQIIQRRSVLSVRLLINNTTKNFFKTRFSILYRR